MKKSFILFFAFGFALTSAKVGSEPSSPTPSPVSEDYRVGPRDKLMIKVWGELDTTQEVSSRGTVVFFFLGEVQVNGLAISEIRDLITRELIDKGYYKDPLVLIQVVEYRSKEVQIHGAVNRPGIFYLDSNYTTLLKLISIAGGPNEKRGTQAYIWRDGINKVVENQRANTLKETSEKEAGKTNPDEEGSADQSEPKYEIPEALVDLERIEVDLYRLIDLGDISKDVIIYPGDFILIQTIISQEVQKNYIWLEGEVRSPSQIEYRRGMTVLQAVIKAGGVTDYASPNRTTITRTGPEGTPITFRVRLKDISKGKRPDVPLQPGDRITVPQSIW